MIRAAGAAGMASAFLGRRKLALVRTSQCSAAAEERRDASVRARPLTVYQYAICPFCNKVKAYLDYLKVPYETVEVNPLTKGEIGFSKDYRKVPILTRGPDAASNADQQQINDSQTIIKFISRELNLGERKIFPEDWVYWDNWCDEYLAVKLYPNITRSLEESWECFGYVENVQSWNAANKFVTRVAGTGAMFLANSKIKKKYNIVDERKELKETIDHWTRAVGTKKFLHGDLMSMPDVMVFGVLRSISGLTTFNEIMARDAVLQAWYARMDEALPSMGKPRV